MIEQPLTIGLLSPGEMGAAVASLLRSRGFRVVTTLQSRGQATVARCVAAGIEVLGSFEPVVKESNILFSIVPPDHAASIARQYLQHAAVAPRGAMFVDVNSISPESTVEIAEGFNGAGISFVDASINGLAKNLTHGGTLFLSGPRAHEIAAVFDGSMRVIPLGPEIGRASAMKMLLGGVSKGVCALFLELALTARQKNMLPELLETMALIYPGIAALVDRMLPTYAQHAKRRAVEMSELRGTVDSAGLQSRVIDAISRLHDELARAELNPTDATVSALVENLSNQNFLRDGNDKCTL